ncbi:craniofacial development protein 2-like [Mytilus trossulus]|uniref:craniofacial development protein 2-like n=1 Tax=Mytilus trossulus TaxID=6551 RepID=UPI003006BDC1
MNKKAKGALIECSPVDERIIVARFHSKYAKMTMTQCYAPTNDADDETKRTFYEKLQSITCKTPRHDILIVLGDMNAKVGNDNLDRERFMGKHGLGTINENGELLVDFCEDNDLVIGGTLFPHKNIHKITWNSPNGRDKNQIDHMMINGRWKNSLYDVRAMRGADCGCGSDHHLICDNKPSTVESLEQGWSRIETVFKETSRNTLGLRQRERKKWISDDTWTSIQQRKDIKTKLNSTKSERIQTTLRKEYSVKDKEVKRKAKADKAIYLETLAKEAGTAASK